MTEWRETTLGEVAVVQSGYAFKSKDWRDQGVPVVKIHNVRHGRVNLSDCSYVTGDIARGAARYRLSRGDVLVTMSGEIGSVGVVRTDDHLVLNQRVGRVSVRAGASAELRYIAYVLQHPELKAIMEVTAYGAAQPNISPSLLSSLPILLPSIQVQRYVSRVLGVMDALIENNRRRVEVLEEMARAIYREWFVHFRYPGHENVTLAVTPLGPIPDGWERTSLGDLVTTQYGYTESASDSEVGPRYLRGMDINKRSYIDWSTVPYCPIDDAALARFRVEVGDVFVIRMADPGKVGMCEVETNAVFASYLVRIRPSSDRIGSYYLFFTLSADEYQGWVTGASTGATRKSVSAKVMTEPRIVLPPRQVQHDFEGAVRPLRTLMTRLVKQNARLRALRDALLPKLVTGQIEVSSLDLDVLVEGSVA